VTESKNLLTGLTLWVSDRRIKVLFEGNELELRMPGIWRFESRGVRPIAPGDIVVLERKEVDPRVLRLQERRNEFTRKSAGDKPVPQTLAANIENVLVIASADRPITPFGLVDRLLATAILGQAPAHLIVNKADLIDESQRLRWFENYRQAFLSVNFTSAMTGEGIEELSGLLSSGVTLLAGSSGVGKSSLVNRLHPGLDLKTGTVSDVTGKGKHITSSARLHPRPGGGWLIDTPGLRECAPWGLTVDNVMKCFPEFAQIEGECRFRNCLHVGETGCAADAAVEVGKIPRERYESYRKLLAEAEGAAFRY